MKFRFLHLSDFHLSSQTFTRSLYLVKKLKDDLKKLSNEWDGNIDAVLVTGDLVNQGETAYLPKFRDEIIRDILTEFSIPEKCLRIIPGNHDIVRSECSETFEAGLDAKLTTSEAFKNFLQAEDPDLKGSFTRKLNEFYKFHNTLNTQHSFSSNVYCQHNTLETESGKVGFVLVNTAWCCNGFRGDQGKILIPPELLEEAAHAISECDLRVFLTHHPLSFLPDWNYAQVEATIAKTFDLVINGHVHDSTVGNLEKAHGSIFVSTAGALQPNKSIPSYSIITIDLTKNQIYTDLRRYYDGQRKEFDQETEKAKQGRILFNNFHLSNPERNEIVQTTVLKRRIRDEEIGEKLVLPIDIPEVQLSDVYVAPVISNRPTFESDGQRTLLDLDELIASDQNIEIFGRPEFGKTTLLCYVHQQLLSDSNNDTVPLRVRFKDLPTRNNRAVIRALLQSAPGAITKEQLLDYLGRGKLTILIDDYNDHMDSDRKLKSQTFRGFLKEYPNNRVITSQTEFLPQVKAPETLFSFNDFGGTSIYIHSPSTNRIRAILEKWKKLHDFDTKRVMSSVLFYFEHCDVPVSPLAITLLLGVLFRDSSRPNIRNEAYLIENFLETVLEKLGESHKTTEFDFPEKELFLAEFALHLIDTPRHECEENEFEKFRLNYFESYDEEIPPARIFEEFFDKRILSRRTGLVRFEHEFYFNFFLAKAMANDPAISKQILDRPDYLTYSTAISYKAGLVRNDVPLLNEIHGRFLEAFKSFTKSISQTSSDTDFDGSALQMLNEEIIKDLKSENRQQNVDARRDRMREKNGAESSSEIIDDSEDVDLTALLTLHSDIIRNTKVRDRDLKSEYLSKNIDGYVSIVWGLLSSYRNLASETSLEDLEKLWPKKRKSSSQDARIKLILEQSNRMVFQIIPTSVALYMADHLETEKLLKTSDRLFLKEKDELKKLFLAVVCLRIDFLNGIEHLNSFIRNAESGAFRFLGVTILKYELLERELNEPETAKALSVIEEHQKQLRDSNQTVPPFLTQSSSAQLKKMIVQRNAKKL